ncbi:MAG: virulence-associated protein E [Pseudomonadales bacterium]
MDVEQFLARLDGVKPRGKGQWYARCPAHEDRGPSLSVKETDDGRILIHCFAGCGAADVVQAAGVELSDLFPEKLEPRPATSPRWPARDLLFIIRDEATLCACVVGRLMQGHEFTTGELERVQMAVTRIHHALEVANVR